MLVLILPSPTSSIAAAPEQEWCGLLREFVVPGGWRAMASCVHRELWGGGRAPPFKG